MQGQHQRRRSTSTVLLLAVLASALGLLGSSAPVQAATTITITIAEGGRVLPVTDAAAGDRVRFLNGASNGAFSVTGALSAPLLQPGQASVPSAPLVAGTSYAFTVRALGLLPAGGGRVSVTAAASPTPSPAKTTPGAAPTTRPPLRPGLPAAPVTPGAPAAPGTPAAPLAPGQTPAPAVPGAVPPAGSAGGNGVALQPRLDSGSLLLLPADPQARADGGLAPQLAPDQTGAPSVSTEGFGTNSQLGGPLDAGSLSSPRALTVRLNDPSSLRQYGLPAVVGLVLLVGAASLVVRVLLATTSLRPGLHGQAPAARTA